MKKFVFNIFIFLVVIFLFNIVVFVFSNDNYYKEYNTFPSKKYHSFILSDSHGRSLEKLPEKYGVYNFSDNSDSYFDMKRKLNYLIENDYQINKIYLTLDNHTISPYRDKNNNKDKSIIYTSKTDFNFIKEKYIKYYFPIFQLKINPLFKIYLEDKLKLIFHQKNQTSNNIVWSELPETEKNKRAEERIVGQFPSKEKSKNLEKTLLEIISLCKKNNIELIGVKFPLSRTYLKLLHNRDYGAESVLMSKRLRVVDCESIFKNNDDYFGDQDHLNSKGAEVFVKKLLDK